MKKTVLLTDLDNTLFVSSKNKSDEDICVEEVDGREQSFMSPKAIGFLREISEKIEIIPVTTRSMMQYKRIKWPEGLEPEYAVTTNGAILLHNGGIVTEWLTAVCSGVEFVLDINEAKRLLNIYKRNNKRFTSCRIVDDSFLFLALPDSEGVEAVAAEIKAQTYLPVVYSGRKIYVLPKKLTKGSVIERLKDNFNVSYFFGAGDSEMDMDMLLKCNKSFAACSLMKRVYDEGITPIRVQPYDLKFSEWFLARVCGWCKKY